MNQLFKSNLNESQLEAVKNTDGYMRIIAGAGAGKTRTLIYKYAYLVAELGIDPKNILAVTFTNKAANEMKKRAKELLGESSLENAMIYTFHGFCVRVLREDGTFIGWPSEFNILDNSDRKTMIKNIIEDNELRKKYPNLRINDILDEINSLKEKQTNLIESLVYDKFISDNTAISEIYSLYLKKEKAQFSMDYNDLMPLTLHLFEKNKEILEKWQNKIVYILVDEFQDVDKDQNDLLRLLQLKNKNLTVIGDPDQNIYSWRGSDNKYILEFNYYPHKDVYITTNYRSTSQILENANSLIKNNKDRLKKDLVSIRNDGDKVIHFYAKSQSEEAEFVVNQIKELIKKGTSLKDIAILYRASYLSRSIEQALISNGIEYQIYSGIRFFEREEIKDIIAYLKLINQDKIDDLSLLRIINKPSRKLSLKKIKEIKKLSEKFNMTYYEIIKSNDIYMNKYISELINTITKFKVKKNDYNTLWDLIKEYLDEVGYTKYRIELAEAERLDNIQEFMNSIRNYDEENRYESITLNKYLQEIALYTNADNKRSKNSVSLMTIHASKGLEFSVVFNIGWNEGILPSSKSLELLKLDGLEEERRLAYVAITRAKDRLFISNSDFSYYKKSTPSRFLLELDENNLERINITREELENELLVLKKDELEEVLFNNNTNFCVGDIIKHKILGIGIVQEIDDTSLLVQFADNKNLKPILKCSSSIVKLDEISKQYNKLCEKLEDKEVKQD